MNEIRIGTRASPLALWQANHLSKLLQESVPGQPIRLVEIQTGGDADRSAPLSQLGGQGVFTKEIQRALLDDKVDVAVHSLKDLPTEPTTGIHLAAVPTRGPTGDALISERHDSFDALPEGATVATGSLRRRAQLLHRRADLNLVEIRGNVDTRLRKLRDEQLDAIILAEAGLVRLGHKAVITELLDKTWFYPAVGQGALGLECRVDDTETTKTLSRIDDARAHAEALAERAMLRSLHGGCHVPIGASTCWSGDELQLDGVVLDPQGTQRIHDSVIGTAARSESLGEDLAQRLLAKGAARLLNDR